MKGLRRIFSSVAIAALLVPLTQWAGVQAASIQGEGYTRFRVDSTQMCATRLNEQPGSSMIQYPCKSFWDRDQVMLVNTYVNGTKKVRTLDSHAGQLRGRDAVLGKARSPHTLLCMGMGAVLGQDLIRVDFNWCADGDKQQWGFVRDLSNPFLSPRYYAVNMESGFCLAIQSNGAYPGAVLVLTDCVLGAPSQMFYMNLV